MAIRNDTPISILTCYHTQRKFLLLERIIYFQDSPLEWTFCFSLSKIVKNKHKTRKSLICFSLNLRCREWQLPHLLVSIAAVVISFLCGISPHLVRSGDISLFVCIREAGVCDVVSIGRERALGMSVCVWRPFIPVLGVAVGESFRLVFSV